jgi:hypothetical protein
VEEMKIFIFKKEDNDFEEILNDTSLKKGCKNFLRWDKHLLFLFENGKMTEDFESYLILKFGDYLVSPNNLIKDFTPRPYIDYIPKRK